MADEHIVYVAQAQLVYNSLASGIVVGGNSLLLNNANGLLQYNQVQILTDGTNPTHGV